MITKRVLCPEQLRQVAASAVSDPRSVSLAAVPELVQPQLVQIKRGAQEPARRGQLCATGGSGGLGSSSLE